MLKEGFWEICINLSLFTHSRQYVAFTSNFYDSLEVLSKMIYIVSITSFVICEVSVFAVGVSKVNYIIIF